MRSSLLLALVLLTCLVTMVSAQGRDKTDILAEESSSEESDMRAVSTAAVTIGAVSSVCGVETGTRFNLEARENARPQHATAVDYLRNRVGEGVDLVVATALDLRGDPEIPRQGIGYYVSRDADCAAEFEGQVFGAHADVAADPARDAVFLATAHENLGLREGAVTVFRTTGATLLNPTLCPSGTHTEAEAQTCWPVRRQVATRINNVFHLGHTGPALAVDERRQGLGAGDVYLLYARWQNRLADLGVWLVVCTNTLDQCSKPMAISASGFDLLEYAADLAIRPDGTLTFTWLEGRNNPPDLSATIRYRACTPQGAPALPTCTPVQLVHHEPHALYGDLGAQSFQVGTYPKHTHRLDTNGTETYVIWEQCKVPLLQRINDDTYNLCPDADIVMKASKDNGVTWSPLTCVSCAPNDQLLPAITVDRTRNIVTIAYYSSNSDTPFQHRFWVNLMQILPGKATPDVPEFTGLTQLPTDPSADPYALRWGFPRTMGVAARGSGAPGGSRAYVHYTYHNIQGLYNGVAVAEPNNHMSRLDY